MLNGSVSIESGGTFDLNGAVSGTAGITKTGPGQMELAGNNSYTGATTIGAGIVSLDDSNERSAIPAASPSPTAAELDISGGLTVGALITSVEAAGTTGVGAIVNLGGTNSLTGDITLAGETTIGVKAGQLTLSGVVDDGGNTYGVTLAGGGTLHLHQCEHLFWNDRRDRRHARAG